MKCDLCEKKEAVWEAKTLFEGRIIRLCGDCYYNAMLLMPPLAYLKPIKK